MPNEHDTDFGVVQFLPLTTFQDPDRGLNREARIERMLEDYDEPAPRRPGIGDWPRVHTAIRRNGMFIIETSTPSFTAMLRFCPERPEAGDYEIRRLPRGGVERGRTLRLKEVPADEPNPRVSMLTPFQVRYFIVTGADDRARTELAWLVGLNGVPNFEESEDEISD
jgi:hypothetical protein